MTIAEADPPLGHTARRRTIVWLRVVSVVCAVALTFLSIAAHDAGDLPLDRPVHRALYVFHGRRHQLGHLVSLFGSPVVVGVVAVGAAVWLVRRDRRSAAVVVGLSPIIAGIVELALKPIVHRTLAPTGALFDAGGDHFPSGHVAGTTALWGAAVLVASLPSLGGQRRWFVPTAGIAVVAVTTMSVARVVVGAHFFTDTVGGVLIGLTVVSAVGAVVLDRQAHGVRPLVAHAASSASRLRRR